MSTASKRYLRMSLSVAVVLEQEQGKVLAECAVELGATDYNWEPNAPCTTDEGLVCNADGTVNTIDLSGTGLEGSICSVIGNLTTLVTLDLSYNSLSGPIPASIGQLPLLQRLDLSYNSLSGPIPASLGQLPLLQTLDLSYNDLDGALPSTIASLSNLKVLDLSSNFIEGALPPTIGSLSRLQVLDLLDNQMNGTLPPSLSALTNMQILDLGNNTFSGSFPTGVSKLTQLSFLSLFYNKFEGSVPSSISRLSKLQAFNLGGNVNFEGEILPTVATLSSLAVVDLAYNRFSGSIPTEFGRLTNLQTCIFLYNQFTGSIPETLSKLKKLSHMDFAQNIFRGTIPSFFATLTKLDMLHFDNNQFSGEIPSQLGSLTNLTYLGFATNALSGLVPPTLGNLLRLTELELNESGTVCPGAGQPCVVKQTPSSQFCINCPDFCSSCSNSPAPSPGSPAASPSPPPPLPPPANNTPPPANNTPPPANNTSSSSSSGLPLGAIIGIAVGGVLVIVLLVIGLFLLWKRRSKPQGREEQPNETQVSGEPTEGSDLSVVPSQALMCQRYSFATVAKATNDWAEANHIGSGGYGEVYRGVSPVDPSVVWAVKRAKILTNDFKREVEEMASKSHPNLVRLLGYCVDMDMTTEHHEQIVIYEICANGDLEKYLTGGPKKGTLTLQQRMDVLVGVARGLEYLHQFDIVHRDIKPANVLLDARMQPKVSEFGLVRILQGTTVNPTHVVSNPGYMDPACSHTNKATPMADVHSFGVLMLEVMLTRPAVVDEKGINTSIKDWAARRVQDRDIQGLKDPHLDSIPNELLLQVVELALRCTGMPPSSRPHMREVAVRLDALSKEFLQNATSKADSRFESIDQEVAMRQPEQSLDDEFLCIDVISGACD
ncbi:unnamed protein product [Closterium sp. Naga37s-1]|nr:unnamed protein product [Closterium sp. Naga37s-1]